MAAHHHHGHEHHAFDPEILIGRELERRNVLPPQEILPIFISRTDATMVDVGCGVGFFTLPAAAMLTGGTVYAADVQQDMVDNTLRRAREQGLVNVEGIVAPATKIPLADHSVDLALMSTMLHDVDTTREKQLSALAEVARILTPGGTLFMIEFDPIEGTPGPPIEIRIARDDLQAMLGETGFTVEEVTDSRRQQGIYFVRAVR